MRPFLIELCAQLSIFSLPYLEHFFELLWDHEISQSAIYYILSIIAMRRQGIFILWNCIVSNGVNIKYCLFIALHIFAPSSPHFWMCLSWFSWRSIFWNYRNQTWFWLLKCYRFQLLNWVLLYDTLKIVRQFFVTFSFASSAKKAFSSSWRVVYCL